MESLTSQALLFIAAAIVFVPLFQWLRLGSVLGYLVAGLLVGPSGFGLVPNATSVLHFAELGVVFLLFLIGLEIEPRKLWSMRRHLIGLGGMQIALTTGVFALVGIAFGLPVVGAVVLAFALSLSSTAYAVQSLVERNEFNTEFGRASFAILLFQDLAAIPALAFIPFLASGSPGISALRWESVLVPVAAIGGLLVAGRFVVRPAFRMMASSRSREIFTAAALFVVLGVALLMQKIGLSAALGTFLAGVLLADSEYHHEIRTNVEPFKGLLMGLFFIAVGMGVDLSLVLREPLLILGLTVAYLALKFGALYVSGRSFGLGHAESKRLGLTIVQGGEFAFVLFGLATGAGGADATLIARLTVVVTLSMALCPLLNLLHDRYIAWMCRDRAPAPRFDVISDESPEIIVAGFGRFGQIFGRILRAQKIPFVAIDHDPDQIELVRRFGNKVYYGDASRRDLLEAAGAAEAKFFVLAIDDVETSLATVRTLREHFPHLKIFARARNRGHAFDLMDQGVERIKRETFDSSLAFVGELLTERGMAASQVERVLARFEEHDVQMMKDQYRVRRDDKMFVSVSKQAGAQLAQVLSRDEAESR